MPVAIGVVEFKSDLQRKDLVMKRIIPVSLGTLVLLSAVTFAGFASSAIASDRHDRHQWQEANHRSHHRRHHHHKHQSRRVPEAASLRKRSW
jgi:hypothetical protein